MELGLRGRIALVTGGSYGIGRRCLALADKVAPSASVPGIDRLDQTAADIARGVPGLSISAGRLNQTISVVYWTQSFARGALPIVNNVGGGAGCENAVEEAPEEKWLEDLRAQRAGHDPFTARHPAHARKSGRV
jgi:NAD(P)-dependent dehydrogenase (short-subunit alcohol dehydrogenase family)